MKLLAAFTLLLSACAQQPDPLADLRSAEKPEAADPSKVYTYVEQMPELPGGGGMAAIVAEWQKRIQFPAANEREQFSSRAAIYLEVNPAGTVQHVKLLRATGSPSVDSMLITAAKSLPRFMPGRQDGHPVTVSLTMPITLCIQ